MDSQKVIFEEFGQKDLKKVRRPANIALNRLVSRQDEKRSGKQQKGENRAKSNPDPEK
jgi:hypothetical protein